MPTSGTRRKRTRHNRGTKSDPQGVEIGPMSKCRRPFRRVEKGEFQVKAVAVVTAKWLPATNLAGNPAFAILYRLQRPYVSRI